MIPTNRPMIRLENTDMVYRTEVEKFRNAAKEIKEYNAKGQPVLFRGPREVAVDRCNIGMPSGE